MMNCMMLQFFDDLFPEFSTLLLIKEELSYGGRQTNSRS